MQGKVVLWDSARSYGFITPDDGSPDVFVHSRQVVDCDHLPKGALVEFEVAEQADGRLRASKVELIR
jgi:cold shock CspA family protein